MDLDSLYSLLIGYGLKLLVTILVLVIGLRVIKVITNLFASKLNRAEADNTLSSFLVPSVKIILQILLVISVASMLGFEMASFIAVMGAAAFAVGLALQGSLANFAGGVLILLLKPFRVGDYIEAVGHAGTVKEIQIFYTMMDSPDNKRIIIPNAALSNTSAVNYSINPLRRVDFNFGVGYKDDLTKVKKLLQGIAENHSLVLDNPPPQVVLGEHGDSSVHFLLRLWCKREDYWSIYYEILEEVKIKFDEEGINIPYPQQEVHLVSKD